MIVKNKKTGETRFSFINEFLSILSDQVFMLKYVLHCPLILLSVNHHEIILDLIKKLNTRE